MPKTVPETSVLCSQRAHAERRLLPVVHRPTGITVEKKAVGPFTRKHPAWLTLRAGLTSHKNTMPSPDALLRERGTIPLYLNKRIRVRA